MEAFKGSGCAICVAGMSMLTEKVIGKTVQEVDEMENTVPLKMLGMEERSPRLKCAVLGLDAMKRAINMEEDDDCDFC